MKAITIIYCIFPVVAILFSIISVVYIIASDRKTKRLGLNRKKRKELKSLISQFKKTC